MGASYGRNGETMKSTCPDLKAVASICWKGADWSQVQYLTIVTFSILKVPGVILGYYPTYLFQKRLSYNINNILN